jgi:two-component sensor histidine kinase
VLTRRSWAGAHLAEVAEAALRPHLSGESGRIRFDGPAVLVAPQSAVTLAMLLHELSTNAVKYGSLSVPGGAVALSWAEQMEGDRAALVLSWRETGGPPVRKPTRKGFGSRLIERGWAASAETEVIVDYRPDGLICKMMSRRPAGPGRREW